MTCLSLLTIYLRRFIRRNTALPPHQFRASVSPPKDGTDAVQLPPLIDDAETIVRAVKTPAHFDSKKRVIKAAAYKPPVGLSVISVMRQSAKDEQSATSDDYCKNKSAEVAGASYVGMLAILAKSIRDNACTLEDAPDDYLGHAHVDHGFPRPPENEPDSAEAVASLNERCKELLKASKQHLDPAPSEQGWKGAPLSLIPNN